MAPRNVTPRSFDSSFESIVSTTEVTLGDNCTVIVEPQGSDGPKFIKCESTGPFVNPLSQPGTAEDENRRLNLNLGQTIITPENKVLVWAIRFLNSILIEWWEHIAFGAWKKVPLSWRRKLCIMSWKLYFPIHKFLLGKRTGIHPDASYEYHALSTIMWGGRMFPVSVQRMRFSLSQLSATCEEPMASKHVAQIEEDFSGLDPLQIPDCQKDHCTVRGLFLHLNGVENPTEWTLLWVYGGAFLSGDAEGNAGKADWIAKRTNMDIFLCSYRLVPEWQADDVFWDVCLAYKWLAQRRDPKKILILGISSGAACCARLMQYIAEQQRGETLLPAYMGPMIKGTPMPAGAILMGPFADFTEPKGALVEYAKHDLIVNQRVLEVGLPYVETHVPCRVEYSPVHRSFRGLPPMCVVTSEHEAVYDMTVDLINRARQDGVSVTVGCWRYMCHVWSFLDSFIPEGRQSMEFVCEWIKHMQR